MSRINDALKQAQQRPPGNISNPRPIFRADDHETSPVVTWLVSALVILLIAAGVAAGLFLIPLNAALQSESDPAKLGKTIAVQNLGDNLGMLLAGAYVFAGVKAGLSSSGVFLGLALGVAALVAWLRLAARISSART